MTFTNGKPWVVTEKDIKTHWGGNEIFCCTLCGHRFKVGDTARWQYTNDVQGAQGNPIVCEKCDATKELIVVRMKELNSLIESLRNRFPGMFCNPNNCSFI